MRASSSSMRPPEGPGLVGVPGGAVAPGQLVEPVEQRTGVADVAAHRPVGPSQPVGVEPQMEVDQLGHHVHVVVRVPQGLHPVAGHPGPDHLVVVEGDPAVDEGPGPRLADVVEEGGQSEQPVGAGLVHHGQGVGQHVLVPVDRILLEGEPGQLGEELVGQAGAHHEPQRHRGHRHHHDLVQLVADPLGRHDGQPVMPGAYRLDQLRRGLEVELGDEPGRPEHAQRVVGEGHLGVQRRAQPVGGQVAEPVEGVDQLQLGKPQGHGVDGEVAAGQILLDRVPEHHLGLAGVGLVGLGPVGGDLVLLAATQEADGAEPLALGPHRVGPAGHRPLDVVRSGVGGEVEVAVGVSEGADRGVGERWRRGPTLPPGRGCGPPIGTDRRARRWPAPEVAVARGTRRRG